MSAAELQFARDGAELHQQALGPEDLESLRRLADQALGSGPGRRLSGREGLFDLVGEQGPLGRIAAAVLGRRARPVRVLLFDKTPERNWTLGWHQDRTIAVRAEVRSDAFAPWSVKDGLLHATPPFELLAGMATLRAHLDDCPEDNAPLLVALGSHRLGAVPAARAEGIAANMRVFACTARAGDVWAYSTPILHASRKAAVPSRRRVLQADYATGDLPDGLEWIGV